MMTKWLGGLIGLAAGIAATAAGADSLTYNDFSSTAGLQLNGAAAKANDGTRDVLRLTPSDFNQSGSAFSTNAINLSNAYSFSTRFTFNINTPRNGGADGIAFVIQPNSNDVGGLGGGIGYQGITNSLGIEFDTWFNGDFGDQNGNHVGIDLGGSIVSVSSIAAPFQLDGGTDLTAWVDYDGANKLLEVRLNNSAARPDAALLSYATDLGSVIGNPAAFVGFTSGTGAATGNHDIVNWTFIDNYNPITGAVPEPDTWAMLVLGFGIVGTALRRRRATPALA